MHHSGLPHGTALLYSGLNLLHGDLLGASRIDFRVHSLSHSFTLHDLRYEAHLTQGLEEFARREEGFSRVLGADAAEEGRGRWRERQQRVGQDRLLNVTGDQPCVEGC